MKGYMRKYVGSSNIPLSKMNISRLINYFIVIHILLRTFNILENGEPNHGISV